MRAACPEPTGRLRGGSGLAATIDRPSGWIAIVLTAMPRMPIVWIRDRM